MHNANNVHGEWRDNEGSEKGTNRFCVKLRNKAHTHIPNAREAFTQPQTIIIFVFIK